MTHENIILLTVGHIPKDCASETIICGDPETSLTKEVNLSIPESGKSVLRIEDDMLFITETLSWFDPKDKKWENLIRDVFKGYLDSQKMPDLSIIPQLWAFFNMEGKLPKNCKFFDDSSNSGEFKNTGFSDGFHWYFRYIINENGEYFNEQIAVIDTGKGLKNANS